MNQFLARWRKPQDDRPIDSLRYVVLDTELTSLERRSNRLLSIGAIVMEGGRIKLGQQFYRGVNPGVDVPAKGIVIHRLRSSDVDEGGPPLEVLAELRKFIDGAVLVGHFLSIDLHVLNKELRATGQTLNQPAVCTARAHQWILSQSLKTDESLDLQSLAKTYGIGFQEAHNALDDAFVTAQLWQKVLTKLVQLNVRTLSELLRIGSA